VTWIAALALAGILLTAACKPTPPPPTATPAPTSTPEPPTSRSAAIAVRDSESAQPVAGARILVGEQELYADSAGASTTEVAVGATLPVEVSAPGYVPWQGQIDATEAVPAPIQLDAALEPNQLQGQVAGQDGQGLPGAELSLAGAPIVLDAQGRFELRRVKDGDQLTAAHRGYRTHKMAVSELDRTLHVSLEPISLTLSVVDGFTGQSIAGVSMCSDPVGCRATGPEGKVVLQPIAPGAAITTTDPGYQLPVPAPSFQEEDHLTVELMPAELTGVVRDAETGEVITKTILLVEDQILERRPDGTYPLPGPSVPYTLFVKSPGYERVQVAIGPDTRFSETEHLNDCADGERQPCLEISLPRFSVYGIYANFGLLNWNTDHMLALIDLVDRSPILNAIVVDVKSDQGFIAFQSENPLIAEVGAATTPRLSVQEFLEICREKQIYTIARMVILKDSPLIAARPELGVRHPNGEIFYDSEGQAWADPTREEVWEYNIAITMETIALGFDEVQYDYLRYPSDSTSLEVVRALVYSIPSTLESRTAAIQGFVMAAKEAIDPTHAFFSADLFGYALSVTPEHDMRIGQRLMDLAPHVDYVCPMVYPSTFIPGNLGLASPSDSPYEVVARSMEYGLSRTDTLLRPWLQGYWYERQDFVDQRRAAEEATDVGWCFWNARGDYDEVFFVPPKQQEP
jgi:hypothetical protein